jgi:hypothetical protein
MNTVCSPRLEIDWSAFQHLLGSESWKPLHRQTEVDFHMLQVMSRVRALMQGEFSGCGDKGPAKEVRGAALGGSERKKLWPPCDPWMTDSTGHFCLVRFHACELGLHLDPRQPSRKKGKWVWQGPWWGPRNPAALTTEDSGIDTRLVSHWKAVVWGHHNHTGTSSSSSSSALSSTYG